MAVRFISTKDPATGDMQEQTVTDMDSGIWNDKQHLDLNKHYVTEDHIHQDIKKKHWSVFSKSMILNFFDDKDLYMLDLDLNILKVNELMSMPPHLLSPAKVDELNKVEHYAYLAAKRSVGMSSGKVNERLLEQMQINQNISSGNGAQVQRKKILGLI